MTDVRSWNITYRGLPLLTLDDAVEAALIPECYAGDREVALRHLAGLVVQRADEHGRSFANVAGNRIDVRLEVADGDGWVLALSAWRPDDQVPGRGMDAAIEEHRRIHPVVITTFWGATCRQCGWAAERRSLSGGLDVLEYRIVEAQA